MSSPSDAPVRAPGSHTRSGNAMARTRVAILGAAAACVQRDGLRRTTMSGVSAEGGIAKATLYNHFRTKSDLIEGLLLARIADLAAAGSAAAATGGLAAALETVAAELAASAPLRRVVQDDDGVVAALVVPGEGRAWQAAREAVGAVLLVAGAPAAPAGVDLVLRWVLAQAVWPGRPEEVALGARAIAQALSEARSGSGVDAGLGWPG